MSSWKKNIKKQLFDKLKQSGYAFNHIRYNKDRLFKIHLFLEEGLIGSTQSPILKNGKYLLLELHYEKILLYETSEYEGDDKILLKQIDNWQNKIASTRFTISNIYEEYFYEIDDLKTILNHRSDITDLNIMFNSIYPELKIRHYEENESNGMICLWVGSGIFTFKIRKMLSYKKLTIDTLFYGSGSFKYQSSTSYNLAKKYRDIIKLNIHTQYVYDFDLTKYKNIYLKCDKVN